MFNFMQMAMMVEVKNSSKPKIKEGSFGILVPFDVVRDVNAIDCLFVILRNGKKGTDVMIVAAVLIEALNLKALLNEKQLEIYDLVRKRESLPLELFSFGNRGIRNSIPIQIEKAEFPNKNLLEWDVWAFIGFIAAYSAALRFHLNTYERPANIVRLTSSISKLALQRTSHITSVHDTLELINNLSPASIGHYILRQASYDKKFKQSVFTDTLVNHFASPANRIPLITSMQKYLASHIQHITRQRINLIDESLRAMENRIKKCIKYYEKHPEIVEELKETGTTRAHVYTAASLRYRSSDESVLSVMDELENRSSNDSIAIRTASSSGAGGGDEQIDLPEEEDVLDRFSLVNPEDVLTDTDFSIEIDPITLTKPRIKYRNRSNLVNITVQLPREWVQSFDQRGVSTVKIALKVLGDEVFLEHMPDSVAGFSSGQKQWIREEAIKLYRGLP